MASCFLVFWDTWVYELIIFKTLSKRILWVLDRTRILLAFVSPSCIMGTDNRGPFKLNSSFGILWIIFYFPPTIKVKMGTFSHFLFFFNHFIMNSFITLYLFYLQIFPRIHSLICPPPQSVFDVFESTYHTLSYMYIINWVNICLLENNI